MISDKKICIDEETFIKSFLDRTYNENMFNNDGTLNKNYNSLKRTGTIAQIFEDHWEQTYNDNKELIDLYRPNANKEIKKVIDCHNKDLGCNAYECPKCHEIIFIGNTCKSRLCSSCGYKYKMERVESITEKAYKCKHRQIVFTVPKELRIYFFKHFKDLINIFFEAVNETLKSITNSEKYNKPKKNSKKKRKYKSKIKWTDGFFAFLHTFGRDLKWNPHIHVLIAEIKLGDNMSYKNMNYFDYDALSKRFQKILLDLISKYLGKSFNQMKRQLFISYPKGFYVYAEPKKFKSIKDGIEYVARYCGRCAISENRILNYDGVNVTFFYNAHEDDSYHEVTISADDFILMILRHLIPEQFKIIRYYGFYRKKHPFHDKMVMLVAREKITVRKQLLKYSISILKSFNRIILNCPKCDSKMKYFATIT
jgi:hypothetical protein